MNGIEKITQRIDADAQAEIDRILADAAENAAGITARYRAQADAEAAALAARNEKTAAEREERLISSAQMEARKTELAARQALVEQAFDLALEKLCAMPDDQYTAVTARMLVQAAPNGTGTVYFPEGKAAVGAEAVKQANALLGEKGKLTLSPEDRPIRGGFLLVDGNVEVNGTFETLVRFQKGTMASEVAKILFPEG